MITVILDIKIAIEAWTFIVINSWSIAVELTFKTRFHSMFSVVMEILIIVATKIPPSMLHVLSDVTPGPYCIKLGCESICEKKSQNSLK